MDISAARTVADPRTARAILLRTLDEILGERKSAGVGPEFGVESPFPRNDWELQRNTASRLIARSAKHKTVCRSAATDAVVSGACVVTGSWRKSQKNSFRLTSPSINDDPFRCSIYLRSRQRCGRCQIHGTEEGGNARDFLVRHPIQPPAFCVQLR